ncbi:MAG: KH domain-containing protein [Actinomycetota bacterium]|nr:KH domain-containing protein [Actinomycetota bacterium]
MSTEAVGAANDQVRGARARDVLDFVAKSIVDDPDSVVIEMDEGRRGEVRLSLRVSPDDMGKVIGRRGRVAQAIRAVVRAAGAREGLEVGVDIVD